MAGPLAYESAHRFSEADIVEGGRSELPGEEIHVRVKPLCNCYRLFQFVAQFSVSGVALIEHGEIKPQRRHLLADLVVYIAGDAAAFVLLRAHDLAEQVDSIPFRLDALRNFIP